MKKDKNIEIVEETLYFILKKRFVFLCRCTGYKLPGLLALKPMHYSSTVYIYVYQYTDS